MSSLAKDAMSLSTMRAAFVSDFPIAFDDLQAEVGDLGAAPRTPVTVVTKFP